MSDLPRHTRRGPRPTGRTTRSGKAGSAERFALYTLCAQAPDRDARLLRAIHAGPAGDRRAGLVLGEDFSAAAALSRAWCLADPKARAVAVDHDPEALANAKPHPRVRLRESDVLAARDPADLIAVLNFSICELHTRRELVGYFRHARLRLRSGGCLVCDVYGGSDSYNTGTIWQTFKGAGGEKIRYGWEQRTADPMTGRVVNAMHFVVSRPGRGVPRRDLRDAFVYDWRLWTLPELREAMSDAGFPVTEVYPRTAEAVDDRGDLYAMPIQDPIEIGDAFNVFVVGRA